MDPLQLKSLIELAEVNIPDDRKSMIMQLKQRCKNYKPSIYRYEMSGDNHMAMLINCQVIRIYLYKLYRLVPTNLEVKERLRMTLLGFIEAVENLQQRLNTRKEIDQADWPKIKKILSK
ncbi:MAG: hypothetical protein PHR00_02470 [Patescibacteria group bacterium]|nr:hypothetical protein [Patescibacteria group bacterium]